MARTVANFVVNCAWCKHTISYLHDIEVSPAAIEQKVTVRIRGSAPYEVWGVESHGVCGHCKAEQTKWLDTLPTHKFDETPCCHGKPKTEFCLDCEAEV